MMVFISGGVRSGKSTLGEKLADELATENKIYLATSIPYDDEMKRRIQRHRSDRKGKGYLTVEKSENIGELALRLKSTDTVLLDCLGNLVANEMFQEVFPEFDLKFKLGLADKIYSDIMKINQAVANLIIVSNEIFSSGIAYSRSTEDYLEVLGRLHVKIAAEAQQAIECVSGSYVYHKKEA